MKSPMLWCAFLLWTLPILAQQTKKMDAPNQMESDLIEVQTASNAPGDYPQIALLQKNERGAVNWFSIFGGTSYEKAADVASTADGGYIILGATSSYGNGNYDLILIKTDATGQQEWFKTFGDFYNEYGKTIKVAANGNLLIEATKQLCTGEKNNFSKCKDYPWQLELDQTGKLVKEQIGDQPVKR